MNGGQLMVNWTEEPDKLWRSPDFIAIPLLDTSKGEGWNAGSPILLPLVVAVVFCLSGKVSSN